MIYNDNDNNGNDSKDLHILVVANFSTVKKKLFLKKSLNNFSINSISQTPQNVEWSAVCRIVFTDSAESIIEFTCLCVCLSDVHSPCPLVLGLSLALRSHD